LRFPSIVEGAPWTIKSARLATTSERHLEILGRHGPVLKQQAMLNDLIESEAQAFDPRRLREPTSLRGRCRILFHDALEHIIGVHPTPLSGKNGGGRGRSS
jgi:hypothetical protein